MIAAAGHTAGGTDLVTVLLGYWWLWLCIGGVILVSVGESFNVGLAGLQRRSRLRHKRKLELKRLELKILREKNGTPAPLPRPGQCVHRNVRPVISADDELVGWLCQCDTQLPPEWAVRAEDL